MITAFGILENEIHTDVSRTLRGAKKYATMNRIELVSVRTGSNVTEIHKKVGLKWVICK